MSLTIYTKFIVYKTFEIGTYQVFWQFSPGCMCVFILKKHTLLKHAHTSLNTQKTTQTHTSAHTKVIFVGTFPTQAALC